MLYSLILRLPILNTSENKYVILFIIASIFYILIHYLLFSKIFNNGLLQKFKYVLYGIFITDLIFAKKYYDDKINAIITEKQNLYEYKRYQEEYLPHENDTINSNFDNVKNSRLTIVPQTEHKETIINNQENAPNVPKEPIKEQAEPTIPKEQENKVNNPEEVKAEIVNELPITTEFIIDIPMYMPKKSHVIIEKINETPEDEVVKQDEDKVSNIVISDDEIVLSDVDESDKNVD